MGRRSRLWQRVTHSLFKSLRHTFQAFSLGLNWCTCYPFRHPISSLSVLSAKQNLSSTCVPAALDTSASVTTFSHSLQWFNRLRSLGPNFPH